MNSSESKVRTCPTCKKSPPEVKFYNKAIECRVCIRARAERIPLTDKIEAHRQHKALKDELKRLAKQRLQTRLDARRRRAAREEREKRIKEFIPQLTAPEDLPVVDSVTKELAARVLTRRRLIEFIKEFHPKYKAGWVHHDICKRLEKFSADVAAGKSPRLMILMPPRHGKSQIASKLFPAWHLGHHPDHEIIACSYNISLALDFSREVREVVRSDRYSKLFSGTRVDPESGAAEAWKLLPRREGEVVRGGYVAAGIGGPINGKGAHVLIIDDPIKNAEEANSVEHLEKIWNWYTSTAYTRLAGEGQSGILLIQTWWSDADLAGRLQEAMKEDAEADQFEVVKYPAIAIEDEEFRIKGEALHPDRFDIKALERIKRTQGGDTGRYWNALYQQNPIPDEGAFFTKSMIRYRDERPSLSLCHIYQAWDFAIGEKRHNDWTVGITIAVDPNDDMHVMDMVRFQSADTAKIADEILDAYERYERVQILGVEDGQIWRGVKTFLTKRMAERGVYPNVEELRPLTDKTVRARPLQGRMRQRKVTLPRQADWVPILLKELMRFPVGMHDDTVDALSWAAELILGKAPPNKPKYEGRKTEKTVAEKLKMLGLGLKTGSAMAA